MLMEETFDYYSFDSGIQLLQLFMGQMYVK